MVQTYREAYDLPMNISRKNVKLYVWRYIVDNWWKAFLFLSLRIT